MNRKHTGPEYEALIGRVREARPDIALSTDVIVGFPGESDEDFAETLSLVDRIGWGGHNWQPMSYSPLTGLVYIPLIGGPDVFANLEDFSFEDRHLNTGLDMQVAAAVPISSYLTTSAAKIAASSR